jgi:Cu/Ag efflux protein CusF
MKANILALAVILGAAASPAIYAAAAAERAQSAPLSSGEVRKVDRDQGKLTIRHGPIANLDMPAMTMVFRVKDPALLNQVKEGDKISFIAEKIDGAIMIMELQPIQ